MTKLKEIKLKDKLKMIKPITCDMSLGDYKNTYFEVVGISEDEIITLKPDSTTIICITYDKLFEHFNLVDKAKLFIDNNYIDKMLKDAETVSFTLFDCQTVVSVKLPNGLILTETSTFADAYCYDFELGKQICIKKIKEQIENMELYRIFEEHLRLKNNLM